MDFDFSPLVESWQYLLGGLGITVLLSFTTAVSSIAVGLAVGLVRLYGPTWLRWLLVFYIDTMRAIPVLVVLVWVYFAVPILTGLSFEPFWAALFALTVHLAAYVAEIFSAGVESIRPGQSRAGLARISHKFCDTGAIRSGKLSRWKSLTAAGQADPFRQSVFQPSAGRLMDIG